MNEELEHSQLKSICDRLNGEPTFHMSLHSKELFHSNFLGWFCENYPTAAVRAFERWVPHRENSTHRVQRERNHLDLVIELPDLAPIVIENKMFAPIDEAQLDRYATGSLAGLDDPTLLLLSLGAPSWKEAGHLSGDGLQWRYVSYKELALALAETTDSLPGFEGDLLRHYVQLVELLQELVEEVGSPNPDEPIGLQGEALQLLERIRLHDAIGKLRARSMVVLLAKQWATKEGQVEPIFHENFTNSRPLIEAFIPCRSGDLIGWQYQGDHWRLAIKTNLLKGDELQERRYEYVLAQYLSWFDFSEIPSIIGRSVTEVPKYEKAGGFYGYNPNFVYRYRKMTELTCAEMVKLSQHFLNKASDWI